MGVPTPQFSASATGRALMYQGNETVAVDAATARTAVYAAPFDALAYNGMQLNGAMDVSQESGTAARTTSGYVVDGWKVASSGSQTFSAAQVADAPSGLSNSLKVTITGANATPGATDYLLFQQAIEGYRTARLAFGTASAQSLSIGFWTKIHRTGAYSGSLQNSAANRSYPFSFTQNVADTWEFKTVAVPGDVTGTWIGATNGIGLYVSFAVALGATYTGAASAWAAANYLGTTGTTNGMAAATDTFQVTGVIVLPGIELPSSERAPLIMRSSDQELITGQQYFQILAPSGSAVANGSAALYFHSFPFPVEMRSIPTVSANAAVNFTSPTASYDVQAIASNMCTTKRWMVNFTAGVGIPSGTLHVTNTQPGLLVADSRL